MSRAKVNYKERDLSAYIPGASTIYVGMILPAVKGVRGKVLNFSSKEDLLRRTTPRGKIEVGMNLAYFSALKILESTNNLCVVIPEVKGAKKAGVLLNTTTAPTALTEGVVGDPQGYDFSSSNSALLISAGSEGAWANDIYITVHSHKETEKVAVTKGSANEIKVNLTQDWTDGSAVRLYARNLPAGVESFDTYFLRRDTDGNSYKFYKSQAEAVSATPDSKYLLTTTEDFSEEVTVTLAVQHAKLPNTFAIRVFHKSNLNDPIETYVCSRDESAKDLDGRNLYVEEVIKRSETIQASNNPGVSGLLLKDVVTPTPLTHGDDGQAVTTGDMIRALQLFNNENEYPMTLIVDGGWTVPAYQQRLLELCKKRGDCFAILSAPYELQTNSSTSAQDVANYRKFDLNVNSSYGALYAPHMKIYDEFNDRYIWASPDGFAASAILETASRFELFYAPAGETRGIVNALDTKVHYTDSDQDLLYDNDINPIIFDVGSGIKVWGQKTLQGLPSKTDRIHVRMLLITVAPSIRKMLKGILFEFNDEPTRAIVRSRITAYLNTILAKRGITSFTVICDQTNNTPADLSANRLNVGVILCPASVAEEINLMLGIIDETVSLDVAVSLTK